MAPAEMPSPFRIETYFDFEANPFWQAGLFEEATVTDVVAAVSAIRGYATRWLRETLPRAEKRQPVSILSDPEMVGFPCFGRFRVVLESGARFIPAAVFGNTQDGPPNTVHVSQGATVAGVVNLRHGDIFIGEGTHVERGATIHGPTILGEHNEIRTGAYLRGGVITGHHGCYRGELKNVLMHDYTMFPHPCFVGDSLCGFRTHFGNQATSANFGLFEGARPIEGQQTIHVPIGDETYDLGVRKFGVVLGDYCQIGCSSVTDPGTLMAPYTMVYPLTLVRKGFYGPNTILKNKPIQAGVVTESPLNFLG